MVSPAPLIRRDSGGLSASWRDPFLFSVAWPRVRAGKRASCRIFVAIRVLFRRCDAFAEPGRDGRNAPGEHR